MPVVFYEEGSKITRMAYCIQPKETSPGSGHTYAKDDVEILDGATSKENDERYVLSIWRTGLGEED